MSRLGMFAYGVAAAIIMLLTAGEVIPPGVYLYERHAPGIFAFGVAGWFVATVGPMALSVCVWRLARRVGRKWAWHLAFLPAAIAIYQAGTAILFYAAGVPDGDSIEGHTLLAATGLLVLTLSVHAVALVAHGVSPVDRKRPSADRP